MATVKLNDGKNIPAVGFGNMHGWENEYTQKAEDVPAFALKQGFRHLDTAQVGTTLVGYITLIIDIQDRRGDCQCYQGGRIEAGRRVGHFEK